MIVDPVTRAVGESTAAIDPEWLAARATRAPPHKPYVPLTEMMPTHARRASDPAPQQPPKLPATILRRSWGAGDGVTLSPSGLVKSLSPSGLVKMALAEQVGQSASLPRRRSASFAVAGMSGPLARAKSGARTAQYAVDGRWLVCDAERRSGTQVLRFSRNSSQCRRPCSKEQFCSAKLTRSFKLRRKGHSEDPQRQLRIVKATAKILSGSKGHGEKATVSAILHLPRAYARPGLQKGERRRSGHRVAH
jgi:hypothetical protein